MIPSFVLTLALAVVPRPATAATPWFGPILDSPAGPSALYFDVGDVNGDGRLDVAITNYSPQADSSNVSVLLGNGDGTFGPRLHVAVGHLPYSLALGDLDGDGRLDMVVADRRTCQAPYGYSDCGTLTVLLGNGDGTFRTGSVISASAVNPLSPLFPVLADLNHDGRLDLVEDDYNAAKVSVFLGNGDGTFGPRASYPTGQYPARLRVADLDGDGRPDLVVPNAIDGTVSVLRGNGNGTFLPRVDYPVGAGPWDVAVADLDGDHKLDLAVAHGWGDGNHTISVLLNNGDGTFAPRTDIPTACGVGGIAALDLDGDGHCDLAGANYLCDAVSVFPGNGDGTFQPRVDLPAPSRAPTSIAIADLNGDALPDLLFAENLSGRVEAMLHTPVKVNHPPDCTRARAVPATLWPPDHGLVPVSIAGVTDPDGDPVALTVTGVTQDEPLNEAGDGNSCPDALLAGDTLQLRAERSGKGNGRVYIVSFTATDGQGGSCAGSVRVCVPHDQDQPPPPGEGAPGSARPASRMELDDACADNGLRLDSLGPCPPRGRVSAPVEFAALGRPRAGGPLALAYSLPVASDVSIGVYDVAGRRVATLDPGPQAAGAHEVSWDAKGVARGMYFCRLQAGSVTVTRSVLVLK